MNPLDPANPSTPIGPGIAKTLSPLGRAIALRAAHQALRDAAPDARVFWGPFCTAVKGPLAARGYAVKRKGHTLIVSGAEARIGLVTCVCALRLEIKRAERHTCEISFDPSEFAAITADFPDWLAELDRTGVARTLPVPEIRGAVWGPEYRWTRLAWDTSERFLSPIRQLRKAA